MQRKACDVRGREVSAFCFSSWGGDEKFVAFLAWKLFFRREANPPTVVIIAANIISALLFAAGHLPSTMQMWGEITPMILLRCFLLNSAGGLAFGYLYRKYGIQYSMMAHTGAHIVWKVIWIILL